MWYFNNYCSNLYFIIILQEHLSSLVTLMGGSCHADLTRVTTHLVAGQVGTTKYHVSSCDLMVNYSNTTYMHALCSDEFRTSIANF